MSEDEDRYENIHMLLKFPAPDGSSWFDYLDEIISKDCQGAGGDCINECGCDSSFEDCESCSDCDNHDHTELFPCTCGLQSMGGTQGTLQQCYDTDENVGHGLKLINLAHAIVSLTNRSFNTLGTHEEQLEAEVVIKAIEWAHKEIEWEDTWNEQESESEK